MHWRPSNVAIIEWRAAIQIDGLSVVKRLPTMISMRRGDGTETSEGLAVNRTTPTTVEIVGQKGRHKIAVACPEPCVLQADALLDMEW